jgi:RNA polymerase sigma-70 factor, ECF subfamily
VADDDARLNLDIPDLACRYAEDVADRASRDDELVARATVGDHDAFAAIVECYTHVLWRQAWSVLGDDSAAEDAVQETFLRFWRNLPSYRRECSLSTWLRTICMNYCRDQLRKMVADRVHGLPLDAASDLAGPSADVAEAELRFLLSEVWPRLPEKQREAFYFLYVLNYTASSAAAIVGDSERTIRWRARRAWAEITWAVSKMEEI